MGYRVLVSDSLAEEGLEVFRRAEGIEVDVETSLSPEELKAVIVDYDAIAIRSSTKLTAEIIEAAERLKVIGRAGIGVDNVDLDAATRKGIVVMNTPEGNTITTAEHTISMLLSMARRIPQANASVKSGKWEKKRFIGTEVFNKTLGIVGMGRIGKIVADRAQGLHMNVIAYDPFLSPEVVTKLGVEMVSLDELLARSDFITVHTPKTKETVNLIDAKAFQKMKQGVYIVNCARGGIVNEKALHDALLSGKVAGAALDVFEKEPPGDNPLLSLEQVICTPHLGASTEEAQVNVAVAVAEQIVDFLLKGTVRNAVNVPSVSAEILPHLRPYLDLAEKLGSFSAQIVQGGVREVHLQYTGEVAQYGVEPITAAVLKGFLTPMLSGNINFVNASVLAKARGIKVTESVTERHEDYSNLVTIKAITDKEELAVSGALLGRRNPRLLRINNFLVEAVPEGNILFIYNEDRPGVIGNIGTTLGRNNINIGMMQFGRDRLGGMAVSLLHLDDPIGRDVLEELQRLDHIVRVIQVEL
ncbi:MAG: phosphoglycerate dehydrogenase [Thermodesulfobacteriota bacterium]